MVASSAYSGGTGSTGSAAMSSTWPMIRPLSRTRLRATWKRSPPRAVMPSSPSGRVEKSMIRATVPNAAGIAGSPASRPRTIRHTPKPPPVRVQSRTRSR